MSAQDTYSIIYRNDVATAIANLEKYIQTARTAFKATEDLEALMKRLGRDTSLLSGYRNAMADLAKAVSDAGNRATKTHAETGKIGADRANVEALLKQVEALNAALAQTTANANQAGGAAAGVGPGAGGSGGGGGAGAGVWLGRAAVVSFAGSLLSSSRNAFSRSEQTYIESADKAQEFRESRREIAAMMGESGVTDRVLDASLRTMAASGMTSQEEAAFTQEYYGSAETGRTKGNFGQDMNADQKAKLDQEIRDVAARFAVQKGLDAKTAGDMAGVVSQYMPINSAADVAGQMNAAYAAMQEGRGAVGPMMQGMMAVAPMAIASGHVSGIPELSAFVGTASTFSRSPKSAGVTYSWLERALNRQKGSAAGYLDRLGVNDKSSNIEKLELVAADLAKVQGDKVAYLQSEGGVGSQEDARALMAFSDNLGVLKANIAKAKTRASQGDDTIKAGLAARTDPNVARRVANAQKEAADIERGRKVEGYVGAMVDAEASLVRKGEIDTTLTNLTDSTIGSLSITSGRGQRIQSEVTQRLADRFKAAGVGSSQFYGRYGAIQNPDVGVRGEAYGRAEKDLAILEAARKMEGAADNLNAAAQHAKAAGKDAVVPMRP